MAAHTPTNPAEAARQRLIWSLHPAIREFLLAVDEALAAWKARDLDATERAMRRVRDLETEYLEVAAQ